MKENNRLSVAFDIVLLYPNQAVKPFISDMTFNDF
jgi:hypothetical protein